MGYAPGGTSLIGMTVPVGNIAPQATSTITNKVNLDANSNVVPPTSEVLAKVCVDIRWCGYNLLLPTGE